MAQRTTTKKVEDLLGKNWDGKTNVQQFIDSAVVLTDRCASSAVNRGKTLTTEELELIERYLACHYYCIMDPLLQSESKGGTSGAYQGQAGMSLESTRYGQAAVNMDWSGTLNSIGKRMTAGAVWLGKPASEQTNYEDRD